MIEQFNHGDLPGVNFDLIRFTPREQEVQLVCAVTATSQQLRALSAAVSRLEDRRYDKWRGGCLTLVIGLREDETPLAAAKRVFELVMQTAAAALGMRIDGENTEELQSRPNRRPAYRQQRHRSVSAH